MDPVLSHRTSLESHPNKVLYHVFIDFKKAFYRVLRAPLWATVKKYNIREWTSLEFAKSQRAVEKQGKMVETGREIF